MEGQEEAPQPAPQQEISAAATSPVEQPQPQKGPGPFRRLWMTVRGQNHQSPGEIHADLADKKLTESEPSVAEMANGPVEKTGTTETTPQPPTPSAPEPVVKNDELRPIGVAATPTSNAGESTGDVDKMISELQENVKKDAAEDGAKAEEAPAPPTTVETPTEDTDEALDAVAANMVKMPDTSKPAAIQPPITVTSEAENTAPSADATLDSNTAQPAQSAVAPSPAPIVAEAPIGIKSAANAAGDVTTGNDSPEDSSSDQGNVVDFQNAAARIQEAQAPASAVPAAGEKTAAEQPAAASGGTTQEPAKIAA